MQAITEETKKKVVKLHIQDGRTISKPCYRIRICHATVSNWIRAYREECQTNDAAKSEYELMQENRKLREELSEANLMQGDCRKIGNARAVFHLCNGICDKLSSVFGSLGTLTSQISDFIGNHRKAFARNTCARRLHRGVQRKDVSLERNIFNGFDIKLQAVAHIQ